MTATQTTPTAQGEAKNPELFAKYLRLDVEYARCKCALKECKADYILNKEKYEDEFNALKKELKTREKEIVPIREYFKAS